jgi:hypothetical protein
MRLRRLRVTLGLASAAIMIASGVAHSALGWRALESRMSRTNADPEVLNGLRVPWQLATLAMVGFGGVALFHYIAVARRRAHDASAVRLTGGGYALFGLWALVSIHPDPFFLSFLVPGALAALCAGEGNELARAELEDREGSVAAVPVSRGPGAARP